MEKDKHVLRLVNGVLLTKEVERQLDRYIESHRTPMDRQQMFDRIVEIWGGEMSIVEFCLKGVK